MITKKEVEHVALLARLELDEGEKELYTHQLNSILEYARELQELNTTDIPPTAHVLSLKNVFREDEVRESIPNEDALLNAPARENGSFKVPKVI